MQIIKNKEHSRVANSIFHQAMSYKMQNFASAKRYQILLSDLADLCHILHDLFIELPCYYPIRAKTDYICPYFRELALRIKTIPCNVDY